MFASRNSNTDSNIETVKLLIEAAANLNLQEKDGWTALMMAIENSDTDSNVETFKLLIEAGADLNLQSKHNNDALCLLKNEYQTKENIELFLKGGLNIKLDENDESFIDNYNNYIQKIIRECFSRYRLIKCCRKKKIKNKN